MDDDALAPYHSPHLLGREGVTGSVNVRLVESLPAETQAQTFAGSRHQQSNAGVL